MATNTAYAGISKVADIDFIGKFDRDFQQLRDLLEYADWQPLKIGQTIEAHAIAGTFQAAQTTPGAAVTKSTYADTPTLKPLTLNRWAVDTPWEDIQKYGKEGAIARKDKALLRDVQGDVISSIMTGISTGASGSASGTGLQAAAAAAWGALGTVCKNETAHPVFFINHTEAAAWLGASTLQAVQEGYGLQYLVNWLGMGTLIINDSVPNDKLWCTAQENIIIATGDIEDVAEFGMVTSEDNVIAVGHRAANDNGAITTDAWAAIAAFPCYADRFIVGTIA